MNPERPVLNVYTGSLEDGSRIQVNALDRRSAVQKIMTIYWDKFPGTNAKERLTIDDPLDEVLFNEHMKCNDVLYLYLPQHVVRRLVESSNGVIGVDPEYPKSRCQIVRLIKKKEKKYTPVPRGERKKLTPIDLSALAAKKSAPKNVWLAQSKILPEETPRAPTVVMKEQIHRTGREVWTHMHLTEIYRE
jgi:hypothetical protein